MTTNLEANDTNGEPVWTPANGFEMGPPSPTLYGDDAASVNRRRLKGRLRELKAFIKNNEADTLLETTRNNVNYPPPGPPEIPSIETLISEDTGRIPPLNVAVWVAEAQASLAMQPKRDRVFQEELDEIRMQLRETKGRLDTAEKKLEGCLKELEETKKPPEDIQQQLGEIPKETKESGTQPTETETQTRGHRLRERLRKWNIFSKKDKTANDGTG